MGTSSPKYTVPAGYANPFVRRSVQFAPPRRYNRGVELRALNRATLARQHLLGRVKSPLATVVEQLLGLQAQLPRPPAVGLWTRIQGFARADLPAAAVKRAVVRATAMRGTIHLLTARDFLAFRACLQPGLDAGLQAILRDRAQQLDMAALGKRAGSFLETPHNFEQVRAHLVAAFPAGDERAMGYAVRMALPLVQVPGEGPWGYPAQADFVSATAWLGKPPAACAAPDVLVLRYLRALGPATVKDAEAWLGLGGLAPAFDRLAKKLAVVGGTARVPIYDLPEAPRPDAGTPAPIRFLPEWDSVIVTRADERIVAKADRPRVFLPGLRVAALVLVDGFAAASWSVARSKSTATVTVEAFRPLTKAVQRDLEPEARALATFMEPEATQFNLTVARA